MDQYPSPDGHTSSLKALKSPFFRYLQSARSILATPSSIGDHQPSIGYKYNRSSVGRSSEKSPRSEPPHRSRSPLLFRNTAVKVEEDVLVMDGVVLKNSHGDRSRSSLSSLTDSGGSSSSSPGGKNYKMDLCVSYLENSGYCRYGTKCQYNSSSLKVLLTAVSSTKFRVHREPLMGVIRLCYNIALNSKSPVNQATSKAMLTQMASIVFRRMDNDSVPSDGPHINKRIDSLKSEETSLVDDDSQILTSLPGGNDIKVLNFLIFLKKS